MEITPLCELGLKYRTDKCPQLYHTYTPEYYRMFKDKKESFKKILELGIGTMQTMKHTTNYEPGASLRMWRDFFPNATVYGVDIAPEAIFTDERIETFQMDTTIASSLERLIRKVGSDLDLVVDDGPHAARSQIRTCRTLMPLLNKNVIYVIEDVKHTQAVKDNLPEYDVEILELEQHIGRNNLLIVKHK